ncbi:MAG: 4-(cytidine 5'-diphospho)-2-C-methyl-D-erythritol kinase [Planctomycetota bacterium]
MPRDTLTLDAPAKVNLALSVGSPDPATGMHPIASWMVAIDFCDAVRLTRAEGGGTFDVVYAADAPRPEPVDWPAERDLGYRAWRMLEARIGRALPTRIAIEKRIPTGAGLGGGSSDAAAVLVGLNDLWDLELSTEALAEVAATLGSDVPFLVHAMRGKPSMVATGLGEVLQPAKLVAPVDLVLVLPDCKCPTGPVYRAFDDRLGGVAREPDAAAVEALVASQPRRSVEGLMNDLAQPAMDATPELTDAVASMALVVGEDTVRVTGSGSTLFTVVATRGAAQECVDRLRARGLTALAAQTLSA